MSGSPPDKVIAATSEIGRVYADSDTSPQARSAAKAALTHIAKTQTLPMEARRIAELALTVAQLTPERTGCIVGDKVLGLDRQVLFILQREHPSYLVSARDKDIEWNSTTLPILQPPAKKALILAVRKRGTKLRVNAGFRSLTTQFLLYKYFRNGECGITAAAPPGRSNHQTGLSIDVEDPIAWKPYLEAEGWRWYGESDKTHFDYVGHSNDISVAMITAFQRLWNDHQSNDKITETGLFDRDTETRMGKAPPQGFPNGKQCSLLCGFQQI